MHKVFIWSLYYNALIFRFHESTYAALRDEFDRIILSRLDFYFFSKFSRASTVYKFDSAWRFGRYRLSVSCREIKRCVIERQDGLQNSV